MKNKVLITTAITALLSSGAMADVSLIKSKDGFNVDIGAELLFETGTRLQHGAGKSVTENNTDIGINSNAAIHLSAKQALANNWNVGLQLGLASNNLTATPAGAHYLDRTYIWAEQPSFGKAEFGSNVSAANNMKIDGDVSGGWEDYVNTDAHGVKSSNFLTSPKLVFKEKDFDLFGSHERSRKVTYYTPKYSGFQYGISYIPDVYNNGSYANMPNAKVPNRKETNGVSMGLTWEKPLDNKQNLEFALAGEMAKVERSPLDKANHRSYYNSTAVMIGGTYKYEKLSLTASYGNHWKTRVQKTAAHVPYAYFSVLGASYDLTEKATLSSSFFYSRQYDNPMIVAAVAGEYKLIPGVLPYASIVFFDMWQKKNYTSVIPVPTKKNDANGNSSFSDSRASNSGTAFTLGTKFQF